MRDRQKVLSPIALEVGRGGAIAATATDTRQACNLGLAILRCRNR